MWGKKSWTGSWLLISDQALDTDVFQKYRKYSICENICTAALHKSFVLEI